MNLEVFVLNVDIRLERVWKDPNQKTKATRMGKRFLLLRLLLLLASVLLESARAFDRRSFFTIKKTPKPVTDPIIQDSAQVHENRAL